VASPGAQNIFDGAVLQEALLTPLFLRSVPVTEEVFLQQKIN